MAEQLENEGLPSLEEAKIRLEEDRDEISRFQEHYEGMLQTMLTSRPFHSTSIEGYMKQLNTVLGNLKIHEEKMRQNQAIVNEHAMRNQPNAG